MIKALVFVLSLIKILIMKKYNIIVSVVYAIIALFIFNINPVKLKALKYKKNQ